jgi:methionine-rich copper-binding protein CopC
MISKLMSLTVAIVALAYAGGAMAHAKLRSSIPASDAVLVDTPPSITLDFNDPVQVARLVLVSGAHEIALKVDAGAKPASRVTVAVPALAPGKYRVMWSALSPADGHVMKGSFNFTLAAAK